MTNDINAQLELLSVLRRDYKFIENNLASDADGFWGRTFIKTAVSLIEAEIFMLKQDLITYCRENNISLKPEVALFLNNKKYEINSSGKIKQRILQIRLIDDIKFTFDQIISLKGHLLCRGYDDHDWSKVIDTVTVRNRLTHPKTKESLAITEKEINDCKLGINWCIQNIVYFLEQEKAFIESRCTKKIQDLDELLEKIITGLDENT